MVAYERQWHPNLAYISTQAFVTIFPSNNKRKDLALTSWLVFFLTFKPPCGCSVGQEGEKGSPLPPETCYINHSTVISRLSISNLNEKKRFRSTLFYAGSTEGEGFQRGHRLKMIFCLLTTSFAFVCHSLCWIIPPPPFVEKETIYVLNAKYKGNRVCERAITISP